jgi:hypothetical protein
MRAPRKPTPTWLILVWALLGFPAAVLVLTRLVGALLGR